MRLERGDMFTKIIKTTMTTKNLLHRVLGDLCTLVIFVKRPPPVTSRYKSLVVAVSLVGLSACASVSAKTPVDRPALMVPPPPPRAIEPAAELPPEPVAELPLSSPPPRSSRPTAPKPAANEARPEAKA